jgi:hypothetical protein
MTTIQDSPNALTDKLFADDTDADSALEPSCFVCGQDARRAWFAQMSFGGQPHLLCSAPCALMFFEAEEAPAHDHRARHDFERARKAIIEAAQYTTRDANS